MQLTLIHYIWWAVIGLRQTFFCILTKQFCPRFACLHHIIPRRVWFVPVCSLASCDFALMFFLDNFSTFSWNASHARQILRFSGCIFKHLHPNSCKINPQIMGSSFQVFLDDFFFASDSLLLLWQLFPHMEIAIILPRSVINLTNEAKLKCTKFWKNLMCQMFSQNLPKNRVKNWIFCFRKIKIQKVAPCIVEA